MRVALSIAGSDPTGGAGLQADLQVFRSLGVHGSGVVTALTVQDSGRVHQVLPVFPTLALEQIRVLVADVPPHAVKLGMLVSDDVARNVELGLQTLAAELPLAPARVEVALEPADAVDEQDAFEVVDRAAGIASLQGRDAELPGATPCAHRRQPTTRLGW